MMGTTMSEISIYIYILIQYITINIEAEELRHYLCDHVENYRSRSNPLKITKITMKFKCNNVISTSATFSKYF